MKEKRAQQLANQKSSHVQIVQTTKSKIHKLTYAMMRFNCQHSRLENYTKAGVPMQVI